MTLRLAKVAWALMPERLQGLPLRGRQDRRHTHGHMEPRLQTGETPLGEGIEPMGNRLARTPQVVRHRRGGLPLRVRQENLAAPYGKSLRGMTPVFQRRSLILGEWSYTFLWLHERYSYDEDGVLSNHFV